MSEGPVSCGASAACCVGWAEATRTGTMAWDVGSRAGGASAKVSARGCCCVFGSRFRKVRRRCSHGELRAQLHVILCKVQRHCDALNDTDSGKVRRRTNVEQRARWALRRGRVTGLLSNPRVATGRMLSHIQPPVIRQLNLRGSKVAAAGLKSSRGVEINLAQLPTWALRFKSHHSIRKLVQRL